MFITSSVTLSFCDEAVIHRGGKSAFLYLDLLHSLNIPLHNHHLRVLSNASRSFWTCSCFSLCASLWLHVHFNTFPVFSPLPFFLFSINLFFLTTWQVWLWWHHCLGTSRVRSCRAKCCSVFVSVRLVYACRRHARCLCVNDRAALCWLVSTLVAPLTFRFLLLFVHIILVCSVAHHAWGVPQSSVLGLLLFVAHKLLHFSCLVNCLQTLDAIQFSSFGSFTLLPCSRESFTGILTFIVFDLCLCSCLCPTKTRLKTGGERQNDTDSVSCSPLITQIKDIKSLLLSSLCL